MKSFHFDLPCLEEKSLDDPFNPAEPHMLLRSVRSVRSQGNHLKSGAQNMLLRSQGSRLKSRAQDVLLRSQGNHLKSRPQARVCCCGATHLWSGAQDMLLRSQGNHVKSGAQGMLLRIDSSVEQRSTGYAAAEQTEVKPPGGGPLSSHLTDKVKAARMCSC